MSWKPSICRYTRKETGWIDGVVEYAGCGSHEAQWKRQSDFRIALAAPEMLDALEAVHRTYGDPSHFKVSYMKVIEALAKAKGDKNERSDECRTSAMP